MSAEKNEQSTLSLHLCNSLYQEVVVDGPTNADRQGLINFLRVLEWRLANTITDEEFSHLYKIWISAQDTHSGKPKEQISKKYLQSLLQNKTELELLGMLGLLVRENNYALLKAGHSPEWCKGIENLFWMLDDNGGGYATQDEIVFLLLAIIGNPTLEDPTSNVVTVATVQQHTFHLMKEFEAKNGIVTLSRFKSYFHRNQLDLDAVHRSITSLSNLLGCISSKKPLSPDYEKARFEGQSTVVPKLWEQAIYQAIDYIHESFTNHEDVNAWGVVDFLGADAYEVRFGFNSEKPYWKLSLLLFKEFTLLYGYVSPIEYTKDSIFNDQNFMLIQQTLRFYDELLTEILNNLFPSTDDSKPVNNELDHRLSQVENAPSIAPTAKLALGEYTAQQVSSWVNAADWVDVLVNNSAILEDTTEVDAMKYSLDLLDLDHTNQSFVDSGPTESYQNKSKNVFSYGIAIENITPTYLQSIFATPTPTPSRPVDKQTTSRKPHKSATPNQQTSIHNQSDSLRDSKIAPIGVVPISKIPHKENLKGRKKKG